MKDKRNVEDEECAHMPRRCQRKEDKGKPINILILAFAMQDQQQNSTNKWKIS